MGVIRRMQNLNGTTDVVALVRPLGFGCNVDSEDTVRYSATNAIHSEKDKRSGKRI